MLDVRLLEYFLKKEKEKKIKLRRGGTNSLGLTRGNKPATSRFISHWKSYE